MSRAFVNEDGFVENLPDRPVFQHPNFVTERGLALIDSALDDVRRAHGKAQAAGDRLALVKAARDLRYWTARRATVQIVPVVSDCETVHFGNAVTVVRDDGRQQTFRIVGEDEADPSKGSISHVSPLARVLLGKSVGDRVRAGRDHAEIMAIK